MEPKIMGAPLPYTLPDDPEAHEMEAYRARAHGLKAKPRPKPKAVHHDPLQQQLVDQVREILRGRTEPMTMLALAEEVARRMGAELPGAARVFPSHPSRVAVADAVRALHDSAELATLMTDPLSLQDGTIIEQYRCGDI